MFIIPQTQHFAMKIGVAEVKIRAEKYNMTKGLEDYKSMD